MTSMNDSSRTTLTEKQHKILKILERFSSSEGMTAMDVGISADYPRKKAEKWARPALKELIKKKLVIRDNGIFIPINIKTKKEQ